MFCEVKNCMFVKKQIHQGILTSTHPVQTRSKQICGWILMWATTGDWLFHWRKHYYGSRSHIFGSGVRLKTLWWICFLQTHSFWLHKTIIDGLEWCGLLWCFYQLFGLSFWRHPFTAEDPLVRLWCKAKFLQIWWRTSTSWMAWWWAHFQLIFILCELFL